MTKASLSNPDDIYGWWIFITHYTTSTTKYQTFYAHLDGDHGSPYDAGLGTTVTRGQRIGFMGISGTGSGIHLHFEIRRGAPGDPSFGDIDDDSLSINLDSQIGCGTTWKAKATMPMDFSSDLFVRMMWYLAPTGTSLPLCFNYGNSRDYPVMGDWNGDGVDSPGVVQGNVWALDDGYGTAPEQVFAFGIATDTFIVGDWDGDGVDTPGVVRGNQWYLNNGFDGVITPGIDESFAFGSATDTFVVGDWNGDGVEAPGLVRDTAGAKKWYLNNNFDGDVTDTGEINGLAYGVVDPDPAFEEPTDDLPVTGNWDGSPLGTDAFDTHGVARGNVWYLRNSFIGGSTTSATYGVEMDTPLPIDRWSLVVEQDTQAVARGSMETTATC